MHMYKPSIYTFGNMRNILLSTKGLVIHYQQKEQPKVHLACTPISAFLYCNNTPPNIPDISHYIYMDILYMYIYNTL